MNEISFGLTARTRCAGRHSSRQGDVIRVGRGRGHGEIFGIGGDGHFDVFGRVDPLHSLNTCPRQARIDRVVRVAAFGELSNANDAPEAGASRTGAR